MNQYAITLTLDTEADTPQEAADYFAEVISAHGFYVTVRNHDTGEETEAEL